MLPNFRSSRSAPVDSLLSGEIAMEALLNALLQKGARQSALQAKAFGGGAIFEIAGEGMDVGLRNATFAKEWLQQEKIPLLTYDLLGPWSRKVLFLPSSGDTFCRRTPPHLTNPNGMRGKPVIGEQ